MSVYPVDEPPTDTRRCGECEALLLSEDYLCNDCQGEYIDWLMERDASADDHTPDSGASRPFPGSGWPLSTGDPVDTPF